MSAVSSLGHGLTVVVVAYNSAPVIAECVQSVRQRLPGAEVILVDNGSMDDTVEVARRAGADRVVGGHGNVGFGSGVNRGVAVASTDLVLVLNPDTTVAAVDQDKLSALGRAPIGLLAASERGPDPERPKLPRRWPPLGELAWALVSWFLLPNELGLERPGFQRVTRRTWIPCSAFLIQKAAFERVGGFDSRLFLYYEDMDLSRRYLAAGLPVGVTDAIRVTHVGRASSPRTHDLVVAWACMSLIECSGNWNGHRSAATVTAVLNASLATIEAVGRLSARVPLIGRRSLPKAQSAAAVRTHLHSTGWEGIPAGAYPLARTLLRPTR